MSAVIILLKTLVVCIAAAVTFLSAPANQSCVALSWVTLGWLPSLFWIKGR